MSRRVTRSSTRQQEEEQRRQEEERYWETVNSEGFELDLTHPELDEENRLLDQYPVTADNWRLFFNDYFNWIVSDLTESLRVSRSPTYQELERMPFLEGGFDGTFYPRSRDEGERQQMINFATNLYDSFFRQMRNAANETTRLAPIVTESLNHIFRNLEYYVDTRDYNSSMAHYSESMVILDLLLNHRLFYLYMTGTPTGNRRRVLDTHPEYYIGIWVRKAPIWGLGNRNEFNFDQLTAFVRNYCRRMIEYMYQNNTNYNLANLGSVYYRGRLRGGDGNDEELKISSIEKNKYNTKYRTLFIKNSVKNAYGRIESMILDMVMDKKLKSVKQKKRSVSKKMTDDQVSKTKTKTKTKSRKSRSKSPSRSKSKS